MKTFVIVYSNRVYKDHFKVAAKSFKDALKTAIIFYENSNYEILGIIEEKYFHSQWSKKTKEVNMLIINYLNYRGERLKLKNMPTKTAVSFYLTKAIEAEIKIVLTKKSF